jgi:hypothetical protein
LIAPGSSAAAEAETEHEDRMGESRRAHRGGYYASRGGDGYNREMPDEREQVERELRRIREAVRERSLLEPPAARDESLPVRTPELPPHEPEPSPAPAPRPPDAAAVNASWDTGRTAPEGGLARFVRRLIAPFVDAQVAWNARQVQLDNAILEYLDTRLDATHRHYDVVLGIHGRHMAEIDERHLILQEELVAHVHDLVKRIDLVLTDSERGRLSLEFALREVRTRLARVEERLSKG